MKTVKHTILVLSGKGGVGKSTFTSQLALALALDNSFFKNLYNQQASQHHVENNNKHNVDDNEEMLDDNNNEDDDDYVTQVGVLDIDLCGPSIPRMFNLEGQVLHQSNLGWEPAYYQDNLAVVSIGFMLPSQDEAVIWRGPKKNTLIRQFLTEVYWGNDTLDYLIIDTPPGTSDEHITITNYLKNVHVDGAIVITTPQEVACIDVRRELNFCKKVGIPVIGIVENMSGFVCPKCKTETAIFKAKDASKGGEGLAKLFNVPLLGKIPLDPLVMQACESGKSILKEAPQSPASKAMYDIVAKVKTIVQQQQQ